MVDYRELPDDRRDELSAMLSYAFSPESGPLDPDESEEVPPQATVGESRGLFDGDDLISVCRHYWFDAHVRGTALEVAGLSAVATPPEYRRRGMIRRLLTEALVEYRERGVPLSLLWPFSTPFYEQFGWATANRAAIQRGVPETFRIGEEDPSGRFYRATEDDWAALDAVLRNQHGEYELTIDRGEEWWRKRIFHTWGTDPYVYVFERDDEPAGYIVYTVSSDGDRKTLRVWDYAAVDPGARANVLRFVADHDSQVERARLYGPVDEVLLDLVDDPADLRVTIDTGAMARIVDVPETLTAIRYPTSAEGECTIAVEDPIAEWNDGRFVVAVEDGTATVTPTDAAPDATLSVGALSQLFVGYRSIGDLVEADAATVAEPSARGFLDGVFPESSTFVREHF